MTDAGRPLVQAQPIDEVIQLLGQLRDCQLAAPQILELRAGVEALTEPGIGALYHLQWLPQIVAGHREEDCGKVAGAWEEVAGPRVRVPYGLIGLAHVTPA